MGGSPIPQRIPPLRWRGPAFLWTPLALALAIAAPLGVFYDDPGLQRVLLAGAIATFVIALAALGVAWLAFGAPKARRQVVAYVVGAGSIVALAAPLTLPELIEIAGRGPERLSLAMALAGAPLALAIGLPMALMSGVIFAWIALRQPDPDAERLAGDEAFRHDVQPFR